MNKREFLKSAVLAGAGVAILKTSGGKTVKENNKITGELLTNVVNKSGSLLPETGGIGTTIFYIVGVVLVLGAGVLLVTKKRMNADK